MTAGADPAAIHAAVAATWPAARTWRHGPVTLRDGQGGGSRVSAATVVAGWTEGDIAAAEAEMGARPLFMLREGEERLDALLAARGYAVMDPVVGYVAPVGVLATERPPPVTTFEVWPVLAAQREIWAAGGIGPARIAVMERAAGPKVSLLGRLDDSPGVQLLLRCIKGLGWFTRWRSCRGSGGGDWGASDPRGGVLGGGSGG